MAKKSTKSKVKETNKNDKKIVRTLGIDLSIGKVKLCLLSLDTDIKHISGGWSSLPVEFEQIAEKEFEFTKGLTIAIEAFLHHHGTKAKEINSIVFCTGGAYYMFKTFAEGMRYTGGILKMIFPRQKVYFIRSDGEMVPLKDIFDLDDSEASAFGCTNFLGTSILASKLFDSGLAIDMGTISTSIIPIINGRIDPVASYNPKGYMLHRYSTGKHVWYGAMHTQLSYITHQAKTQRANYNLILRSCSTNTLCSILNLLPANVANVHVSPHSQLKEYELSLMQLAETVGLDINSISEDELIDISKNIYYQFIYKISDIIRVILSGMNYPDFSKLKVLSAGLGESAFISPALLNCGFSKEQIIKISEDRQSNLWTAASVYGLALRALEEIVGEKIDVSVDSMAG